jgi:short-subunit dehydrogenase
MSENQKKIWITGASSGIGKAVAEKFAYEGWKVAVSARRKEILDNMAQDLNIKSFPLDVTKRDQIENVFKNILNDFGELDLCLFSSGTYEPKDEQSIDPDKIKNVININFLGVIDCVKTVEEYFKKKKSGHISIVSSIAGYRGLPNSSGYGPSKAALTNFSESIYFDFKKFGVRVSIVSPGFIKTPLTDKNEFPMPFLKTPQYAAKKIFNGLVKSNAFEIHFPKGLTLILKLLRILPYKLYLFLVDKLVKR